MYVRSSRLVYVHFRASVTLCAPNGTFALCYGFLQLLNIVVFVALM